jgi:hypothetical protein
MKKMAVLCISSCLLCFLSVQPIWAENADENQDAGITELDEFNPFAVDAEKRLREMDRLYEQETQALAWLPRMPVTFGLTTPKCYRDNCMVWAKVSRNQQKMSFYVQGKEPESWLVSTGAIGNETPNFDTHPNGRIYDGYTSNKHPGGDYNGLGNMPYAVFISEGFAVHGTGKRNWPALGTPASHGCVRIHPDNAHRFNRHVREVGVDKVWITVQD